MLFTCACIISHMLVDFRDCLPHLFVYVYMITCWLIFVYFLSSQIPSQAPHYTPNPCLKVSHFRHAGPIFAHSPICYKINIDMSYNTPQQVRQLIDDVDAALRAAILENKLKDVFAAEKTRIVSSLTLFSLIFYYYFI